MDCVSWAKTKERSLRVPRNFKPWSDNVNFWAGTFELETFWGRLKNEKLIEKGVHYCITDLVVITVYEIKYFADIVVDPSLEDVVASEDDFQTTGDNLTTEVYDLPKIDIDTSPASGMFSLQVYKVFIFQISYKNDRCTVCYMFITENLQTLLWLSVLKLKFWNVC